MKLFIDTEWHDMIQDLSPDKQVEIMRAILAFPNGNSDTHIWNKIIKPQLEQSAKLYKEKSDRFAENRKKRWQQKYEQICEQISDKKSEQISNRYQNVNVNVKEKVNINSRKDSSSLQTTRVQPTQDEVLEYARQQNDMAGVGGFACTEEQAQDFYDYYSGIGWHLPNDAQTPILDWKPFFRKWVRNPKHKNESLKDPNDEAYEADLRFFARRKREREEEARNGGKK